MYRTSLGMLLWLLSAGALAQTTNCSTYGNSMNCQTYGGTSNQQPATTNCYQYGNNISCQQYAAPQLNPNGCGTAAGCALQGYEQGRQQAQQQQIQEERLEQLRLQNQLLQQQIESQQTQSELEGKESQQRDMEVEGQPVVEPNPNGDTGNMTGNTYPPATRTRVLEAEYCLGFGTAEFSTMQYRTHQDALKSDTVDSQKVFDPTQALQEKSSKNATLASYIVFNSSLADDASLHKFYNDGLADYHEMRRVMDRAYGECSSRSSDAWVECTRNIITPEADRLGVSICNNLDFLNGEPDVNQDGGN
jgi:hypothetical protein